jgi:hypothetical protein
MLGQLLEQVPDRLPGAQGRDPRQILIRPLDRRKPEPALGAAEYSFSGGRL